MRVGRPDRPHRRSAGRLHPLERAAKSLTRFSEHRDLAEPSGLRASELPRGSLRLPEASPGRAARLTESNRPGAPIRSTHPIGLVSLPGSICGMRLACCEPLRKCRGECPAYWGSDLRPSGRREEDNMSRASQVVIVVLTGLVAWLGAPGWSSAAARDLSSGLAYLRAGSQRQAEEHLTRFRDEERDPEIRHSVSRILPLLRGRLSRNAAYIASTLEEATRGRSGATPDGRRPHYWSRVFPVFP